MMLSVFISIFCFDFFGPFGVCMRRLVLDWLDRIAVSFRF